MAKDKNLTIEHLCFLLKEGASTEEIIKLYPKLNIDILQQAVKEIIRVKTKYEKDLKIN